VGSNAFRDSVRPFAMERLVVVERGTKLEKLWKKKGFLLEARSL